MSITIPDNSGMAVIRRSGRVTTDPNESFADLCRKLPLVQEGFHRVKLVIEHSQDGKTANYATEDWEIPCP